MFATRLLSGIVLVALAVFLLFQGGPLLLFVSAAISLIGLFELYRVMKIERAVPGILGYLAGGVYYGLLWFRLEGDSTAVFFLMILFLMLLMTVYVVTFPKYSTEQITVSFFGLFYLAVMFSYVYQVRSLADGRFLVWLILISSWGCDTCAYCAGMLFGKHKLAPVLSPKKTVEGAIGGVLGAALLGFLYGLLIRGRMTEIFEPEFVSAAACAVAAVISQIGDLAASAIKRNHNVKDYGHLIPGHGGVLDRFDSMIFTAPAVYFAVLILRALQEMPI